MNTIQLQFPYDYCLQRFIALERIKPFHLLHIDGNNSIKMNRNIENKYEFRSNVLDVSVKLIAEFDSQSLKVINFGYFLDGQLV